MKYLNVHKPSRGNVHRAFFDDLFFNSRNEKGGEEEKDKSGNIRISFVLHILCE